MRSALMANVRGKRVTTALQLLEDETTRAAVGAPLDRHVRPALPMRFCARWTRAGWALDWVDLDLTGSAPRLEIRATRYDGLWVRAYVDQQPGHA